MAPEEDDALLFLIYRHLKLHGYENAAKVLEKHVTQVRNLAQISDCCSTNQFQNL